MRRSSLDARDRQILEILQEDGRAPHASIAERVGLSAPAIRERILKLEHAGVIQGYRAIISPEALGLAVTAFVALTPRPGTDVARLVERLKALSEVEALHSVAGTYSYLAKVRAESNEALDEFLDRLMMTDGIERTETTMVLRTSLEGATPLPWRATD